MCHLPPNKPTPFAMINILCCPVIIDLKQVFRLSSDYIVIPTYTPRTMQVCPFGMLRLHISSHTPPARVIVPFPQHFNYFILITPLGEPGRAAWLLLKMEVMLKDWNNGFIIKMEGIDIHVLLPFGFAQIELQKHHSVRDGLMILVY